ncbi:hypothetical protein Lalb_Chr01g0010351 [Lupinus albus]|uniref:Uncharacterized protein n=1 Tax=Lupinus albus TaxID=3870 RepID=A0A6A4R2T9_LUPAL|nr:hypothetical protein Lalb_Chr01g0010351 [Lupinus albus]
MNLVSFLRVDPIMLMNQLIRNLEFETNAVKEDKQICGVIPASPLLL